MPLEPHQFRVKEQLLNQAVDEFTNTDRLKRISPALKEYILGQKRLLSRALQDKKIQEVNIDPLTFYQLQLQAFSELVEALDTVKAEDSERTSIGIFRLTLRELIVNSGIDMVFRQGQEFMKGKNVYDPNDSLYFHKFNALPTEDFVEKASNSLKFNPTLSKNYSVRFVPVSKLYSNITGESLDVGSIIPSTLPTFRNTMAFSLFTAVDREEDKRMGKDILSFYGVRTYEDLVNASPSLLRNLHFPVLGEISEMYNFTTGHNLSESLNKIHLENMAEKIYGSPSESWQKEEALYFFQHIRIADPEYVRALPQGALEQIFKLNPKLLGRFENAAHCYKVLLGNEMSEPSRGLTLEEKNILIEKYLESEEYKSMQELSEEEISQLSYKGVNIHEWFHLSEEINKKKKKVFSLQALEDLEGFKDILKKINETQKVNLHSAQEFFQYIIPAGSAEKLGGPSKDDGVQQLTELFLGKLPIKEQDRLLRTVIENHNLSSWFDITEKYLNSLKEMEFGIFGSLGTFFRMATFRSLGAEDPTRNVHALADAFFEEPSEEDQRGRVFQTLLELGLDTPGKAVEALADKGFLMRNRKTKFARYKNNVAVFIAYLLNRTKKEIDQSRMYLTEPECQQVIGEFYGVDAKQLLRQQGDFRPPDIVSKTIHDLEFVGLDDANIDENFKALCLTDQYLDALKYTAHELEKTEEKDTRRKLLVNALTASLKLNRVDFVSAVFPMLRKEFSEFSKAYNTLVTPFIDEFNERRYKDSTPILPILGFNSLNYQRIAGIVPINNRAKRATGWWNKRPSGM